MVSVFVPLNLYTLSKRNICKAYRLHTKVSNSSKVENSDTTEITPNSSEVNVQV